MGDIRKVSETREKDGDWDAWPYPTVTIESVVSGGLRSRILAKLGRPADSPEVRLVEMRVSGGFSEYTQEDECAIEIRIGEQKAWEHESTGEWAMAEFLAEFGGDGGWPKPSPGLPPV
jgi:hypothetical protein